MTRMPDSISKVHGQQADHGGPVIPVAIPSLNPSLTSFSDGIAERQEHGLVVLSPSRTRPIRRVLFVNCYGGKACWEKIKRGLLPPHHLWGCLELVRMGYEVALAEPLADLWVLMRRPSLHDLKLLRIALSWLGRDGILYCGHNFLYFIPLLRVLGVLPNTPERWHPAPKSPTLAGGWIWTSFQGSLTSRSGFCLAALLAVILPR